MGIVANLVMTAVVLILMVPGLVIEPGPISEIIGVTAILAIWGLDDDVPAPTEGE